MMATKKDNKKYLNLRDSFQDSRINQLLDKILFKEKLSSEEKKFLDRFENLIKLDLRDYCYISKNSTIEILEKLLKSEIKVVCDLEDRDGKLGIEIEKVELNFFSSKSKIILKKKEECYLEDKFLYNLIFDINKNHYSLTTQDEYFEKIKIDKNED